MTTVIFLLWIAYLQSGVQVSRGDSLYTSSSNAPVEAAITFTKAASKPSLRAALGECLRSLLALASPPLHIRIIGDEESQRIAETIFTETPHGDGITMSGVDMEPLARAVTSELGELISFFRHSKKAYYGDSLFFLSIIAHKLFPQLHRLILLDADLSFRDDIRHLWSRFESFGEEELIGIGPEMQPVYRHMFSSYRSQHKGTTVGEPYPDGFPGFNSGVLLLDLAKLRASTVYPSLVQLEVVRSLASKYGFQGHLGDQDLYTLLAVENPQLFHRLPCVWNRQLCTWWRDKGYESVFHLYHRCEGPVRIYHGNCNSPIPQE